MSREAELEWLCQEAGLPHEYASRLAAEGLSVRSLHTARLDERRDVFRGMGMLYGQIMAIHRALERWEPPDEEEEEEEEEVEEEGSSESGNDVSGEGADGHSENEGSDSYEMIDVDRGDDAMAVMAQEPQLPPKLQAAAMLLARAGRSTLMGLGLYLGNAISQPNKPSFRTIHLTNPVFQERIWTVSGGASLLRAAGFTEGPKQTLILPDDVPLQSLLDAKELVDRLLAKSPSERPTPVPTAASEAHEGSDPHVTTIGAPARAESTSPAHVARRRKQLAQSMRSIEAMVEDAHTGSWDAALSSKGLIEPTQLSVHEIRCCRACNQGRLAALLGRLLRPLWTLTQPSGTEHLGSGSAAARIRLLNLLQLITRLMPTLLEEPQDAGIEHLLWTELSVSPVAGVGELADAPAPQPQPQQPPQPPAEVPVETLREAGSRPIGEIAMATPTPPRREAEGEPSMPDGGESVAKDKEFCSPPRSLGGCLIMGVLRSLFIPGFSLMGTETIMATSSGNAWDPSSATVDEARETAMRALIACCSASLFIAPQALGNSPNRMLLATVNAPQPYVKALFRALFSVIFSYDPVGLGIPYAHSLVPDSHYTIMHVAAQLLMILLSQPAPLVSRQVPMGASQDVAAAPHHLSDKMSRLLGGLQRPETLQFLVGGFRLLLRNGYASRRTYLPSALVELDCLQELLLLLWRFLSLNRRFAETLLDAPEVADVVLSLCYFILSWCDDDAKHSWVHLNVLCLLILSAEQGFGSTVNEVCPHILPLTGRHSGSCKGTIADLLVACCYELIRQGKDRLESMLPAALAVLANIAPHVKTFSDEAASQLIEIVDELGDPSYLFAAENRPELLIAALDVISSSLLYQHTANLPLEVAIFRAAKRLRALPFAAPSRKEGNLSSGKTDGADVTLATVTDTPSAPKGAIVRDVEEWKARLPLQPIFRFLDYLHKKAGKKASESTVRSTLRGFSLAGVLPPPPPLVVRRYVPNSYSQTWLTQMLWGVIYIRNQDIFDAKRIKLVPIMKVPTHGN